MSTHSFSWRLALSDEDLKAAYNMRHEVFVKEHGFDAGRELDSFDDTAAQLLLIDDGDNSVQGTLRVVPLPVDDKAPLYYDASRRENSPPGSGRTEEQVISALVNGQQLLEQSADGPSALISGVRLGRIAVHTAHRGRGGGRHLLDGAEKWIIQALNQTPVTKGTKEVDATIEISGLVGARKFYDHLGYHTDNNEYMEEGHPHLLYSKRITVRKD
ncbi:hypothetical protein MBRA1_000227 [Malassezia brasiliensis]|uniref:N-acetyltransferase domain-containing protein n=1 Tax=Malassezia brasiliensis TaxID=1821822 RepID=A0AAF0DQ68_9BASI|nr:hypothetical protein MBRA1_000227 [Malassezia brasiliensis]